MIKVKRNILLAPLSTFEIGNQVKFFCKVKNDKELLEALKISKELKVPYKIIAGGSNIVFPDGILNCFLIKIKSSNLKISGNRIMADAGVDLMRVIKAAIKNGLAGLETLSGIPGTVGGAIVGNAGAYGHSISEVIEKVEILDPFNKAPAEGEALASSPRFALAEARRASRSERHGRQDKWLKNKDCKFGYRNSIFKEKPYIILRAVLKLKNGNRKELRKIFNGIIKIREKKYLGGIKCAGSFFKNILVKNAPKRALKLIPKEKIIGERIPVGYLLEIVGVKGMKIGDIQVADFHANFLINNGHGTAKDAKELARILKERIKRKFGVVLEEEIRYF